MGKRSEGCKPFISFALCWGGEKSDAQKHKIKERGGEVCVLLHQ